MAPNDRSWGDGDGEKRQLIRRELMQLKQLGKSLKARAMRSFLAPKAAAKPPQPKPASIAA